MEMVQTLKQMVDAKKEKFWKVNDDIWATPELYFREVQSANTLMTALREEGFAIENPIGEMETAFVASWGSGGPVIGYLAEYDALPSLSQVCGLPERQPVTPGGPGHGCGHNALGTGAAQAAVALKDTLEANGLPGTVKLFGCPAEEAGCGKPHMIRAGAFEGVDFCITWHPGIVNKAAGDSNLANRAVYFHFRGKSSHAAAAPHLGRSALDACELMNVGVNYLREHVIQEARIHYAYQDVGGSAPNVVQNYACLKYYIRAPKAAQVLEIADRVFDIARGAALMTGTTVEIDCQEGCCDYRPNRTGNQILTDCLMAMGGPEFDEADFQLAQKFFDGYDEDQRRTVLKTAIPAVGAEAAKKYAEMPLVTDVFPYVHTDAPVGGSTDVGDVSYIIPTAQCSTACYVNGTAGHSWQATAATGSSITHKATDAAARAMALCGLRYVLEPELVQKSKEELLADTGGVYQTLLGDNARPFAPTF